MGMCEANPDSGASKGLCEADLGSLEGKGEKPAGMYKANPFFEEKGSFAVTGV